MGGQGHRPDGDVAVDGNYYRPGEPLTREGLFQLVTDEVFKDGVVEDWENRFLGALVGFLNIDRRLAREIAKHSKERYARGELGSERPLDGKLLFERVFFFALADGIVDASEDQILAVLQKVLKISDEERDAIEERVTADGYADESRAFTKPVSIHLTHTERERLKKMLAARKARAHELNAPAPRVSQALCTPEPSSVPPLLPSAAAPSQPSAGAPQSRPTAMPASEPGALPQSGGSATPLSDGGRRTPGLKAGSVSYKLKPGGVPLPPMMHAACTGAAVVGAVIVWLLCSAFLKAADSEGEFRVKAVAGAAIFVYWGARKGFERSLLPAEASLDVNAERIQMPGALFGQWGVVSIRRAEVTGIWLERGKDRAPQVISIATTRFPDPICFWNTALDADLKEVADNLQAYMLKPVTERDMEISIPKRAQPVVLVITLIVLGAVGYYFWTAFR